MKQYRYEPNVLAAIEASRVPFAVYQFINKRVVTIALSAGFMDLFGLADKAEAYELMNNNMYRDAHPDDVARIADAAVRFATEGGSYQVVYRNRSRKDGEDYLVIHARGEHVYKEDGTRLAVIWYTDEGRFHAEAEQSTDDLNRSYNTVLREGSIIHRQHYDTLTGLPNMAYFYELAEAGRINLKNQGQDMAVVFFDLCGMKAFNRKYGFEEGDRLLRAFSQLLALQFSNENCGRFGQDHFAVFARAEGIAETLREIFVRCKQLNEGRTLPVRAGVYLFGDESLEIGSVCDRAKMACDVRRNTYISYWELFQDSMLTAAAKRQYIVDNLDRALNEHWISVYYQPIIRSANGQVCNEEALARWEDPENGRLSPADFIPVLEDARLIYKLDLFVLEQMLEKMRFLSDLGLYIVPASINLSRVDFDMCDIVEEVRRRVDAAGFPHDRIIIEITESVIASDFDFMKTQVERFRALGFPVWMDDFGSGYSSLDALQSISFDLIKLDMRFMQQFDGSERSKVILTELVRMAMGLGLETVAEGVETADQVEFLRELGCTKLQGFYFCKAISIEEIVRRNRDGAQFGFENPAESAYYSQVGKLNLYDPTTMISEEQETLGSFLSTMPMAILESDSERAAVMRCNASYRRFLKENFGVDEEKKIMEYTGFTDASSEAFTNALIRCGRDGGRVIIDERTRKGGNIHAVARRVGQNPVTGMAAVAVAVLSISQ